MIYNKHFHKLVVASGVSPVDNYESFNKIKYKEYISKWKNKDINDDILYNLYDEIMTLCIYIYAAYKTLSKGTIKLSEVCKLFSKYYDYLYDNINEKDKKKMYELNTKYFCERCAISDKSNFNIKAKCYECNQLMIGYIDPLAKKLNSDIAKGMEKLCKKLHNTNKT